jgi:hypothetical protein
MPLAVDGPLWTDVVTAIATAVGVVAAIAAGLFAGLAYMREVARDEQRHEEALQVAEDRRRAQAGLVVCWLHPNRTLSRECTELPALRVRNASQLPVYEARAYWTYEQDDEVIATLELGTILPSDVEGIQEFKLDEPMAMAIHLRYDEDVRRAQRDARAYPTARLSVEVRFADADNRHWHRSDFGLLTRAFW